MLPYVYVIHALFVQVIGCLIKRPQQSALNEHQHNIFTSLKVLFRYSRLHVERVTKYMKNTFLVILRPQSTIRLLKSGQSFQVKNL